MLRKEHFYRARHTWILFLFVLVVGLAFTVVYTESVYFILAVAFAAFIVGTAISAIAGTRDRWDR
jgi:hypothetical protein